MNKVPARNTLYHFTTGFPYIDAADRSFSEPELPYLHKKFEKIVNIPYYSGRECMPLPEGVSVDKSFSAVRASRVWNPLLWLTALEDKNVRTEIRGMKGGVRRILAGGLTALAVARWVRNVLPVDGRGSLLYTNSLSPVTLGICKGVSGRNGYRVVSRCIGGDVREENHKSLYIPYKRAGLEAVDWLFPVSSSLRDFLIRQKKSLKSKSTVARNGVPKAGFMIKQSTDGRRRILSCGSMVELKRYDLLAKAMILLAKNNTKCEYEWRHMLWGKMDKSIKQLICHEAPSNLSVIMVRGITDVVNYYKKISADLFVHVSRSEGWGLAVSEALSCGLPVLATDSGGVADQVEESVGRLICNEINERELANHIGQMLGAPSVLEAKKERARLKWEECANSKKNYEKFANNLLKVSKSRDLAGLRLD
ncbi:MAG: hypothetical protein CMO74_12870 [Verrucomicrobiales bacterium]|nr:hypothetical protein [Verrucomicrobiales bacterium]|tara:strand:+ start:3111 stop:4376 length:1266 start_codon:yes stop_codon:yes gene_type:complete